MPTSAEWYQRALDALERSRGADRSHEYESDLDDALSAFDQAIHIDPKHFEAQRDRGFLLAHREQYEAALDSFVAAAALRPPDLETLNAVGTCLLSLKLFERALDEFDEVLRREPNDDVALVGRAEALSGLRRDEEAIAAWDAAIAVLDTRKVEHDGKMIRDLTDDWRADRAREARAAAIARG